MTYTRIGISLLGILVLAAIVIAVVAVAWATRRSKAGKWLTGILAVAAVAVALVVALRTGVVPLGGSVRTGDSRRPIDEGQIAMAQPWTSQAGEAFLADVYPSEAAAAEALAKHLASKVAESPGTDGSWEVRLSGSASAKALQRAEGAVRNLGTVEKVTAAEPTEAESRDDDHRVANIRIDAAHEGSDSGTVLAALDIQGRNISTQVRFVNKPWVADLAEFLSRDPNGNWLAAASDRPCTSHHEAQRRAMEIAAARLTGPVSSAMERAHRRTWSWSQRRVDARRLQSAIQAELDAGWLISDQFAQQYHRPYGDVWQHWLLVDASFGKVHSLAAGVWSRTRAQRRGWLWRGLSLAGVVGVVLLVYLFLNFATRGYYVWSLRIAAAVLGVIAVIVLLNYT